MVNNYYLLSEDEKDLQLMVRDFMNKEVKPLVSECDEKSEVPMEAVKKAIDMGLHCMSIPEEYGALHAVRHRAAEAQAG